jgi:hypothetical protein
MISCIGVAFVQESGDGCISKLSKHTDEFPERSNFDAPRRKEQILHSFMEVDSILSNETNTH